MPVHCIVLAHDASTCNFIGYAKIGIVIIEDNVFVGVGCTILPNAVIGEESIVDVICCES